MEKWKIVHPTTTSNMIRKENVIGSAMKRKTLSDITNNVSSSRPPTSTAQFQENVKEFSCGITKDYISQLMEENATLFKAIGERNKIIELSTIELHKLRLALEKLSQQNRQLALTNSQMLAELNLSKERVKALQHELGCSVAVIRLKNSGLDEKEKLNKELCEKIRAKEKITEELCEDVRDEGEPIKHTEITTDSLISHSTATSNLHEKAELHTNIAPELDKDSKLSLEKEKLNKETCENITKQVELSKLTETITNAMKADSIGTNNLSRKRSLRNQNSTSLAHQVQAEKKSKVLHEKTITEEAASRYVEFATNMTQLHSVANNMVNEPDGNSDLHKLNGDACKKISSEEKSNCVEAATLASEAHSVDTNMATKPNRKHSLRSQTTCSENSTHQVEEKEKDDRTRRKSSRRKYSNLEIEPCKSKDYLFEIVDADIPYYSSIGEPPNERKPIPLESSDLPISIAYCEHGEDGAQKDRSSSSQGQTQGPRRPMRKAAEKVRSYKEIPLTVKMRRLE